MALPSWVTPQTFPENFGTQASPWSGFFTSGGQQWAMPTNPEQYRQQTGYWKGYVSADQPGPNGETDGSWVANFDENGQMVGQPTWEKADKSIDPALIAALALSAGVATNGFGLLGSGGAENAGAGSLVSNSEVAQSFPVAAYGPAQSQALAPVAGLPVGAGYGAGTTIPGYAAGSGGLLGSGGVIGPASSVLNQAPKDTGTIGGLLSALGGAKTLLPLGAGLLSYLDAQSQNGKTTGGYEPARDFLMQQARNPVKSPWGRY